MCCRSPAEDIFAAVTASEWGWGPTIDGTHARCALHALISARAGVELNATPMAMAARAIAPGVSVIAGSVSEDGDATLWCVTGCMSVFALTSVSVGRSLRLEPTLPLGRKVRGLLATNAIAMAHVLAVWSPGLRSANDASLKRVTDDLYAGPPSSTHAPSTGE